MNRPCSEFAIIFHFFNESNLSNIAVVEFCMIKKIEYALRKLLAMVFKLHDIVILDFCTSSNAL